MYDRISKKSWFYPGSADHALNTRAQKVVYEGVRKRKNARNRWTKMKNTGRDERRHQKRRRVKQGFYSLGLFTVQRQRVPRVGSFLCVSVWAGKRAEKVNRDTWLLRFLSWFRKKRLCVKPAKWISSIVPS